MTSGYEYGNTRLRARKAQLLSEAELVRLAGSGSVARLINALADLDYGPDLEAALLRRAGLELIDSALSRNLARTLRRVRSFYPPGATEIDLLVRHWDLHNLQTIIRGQARLHGTERITALLIPAARLSEGELVELSSRPSLRAAIDLIRAWGVPSRRAARRLSQAWPDYERSGIPAVLEETLHQEFAADLDTALAETDETVSRVLRTEVDAHNLMLALRLREMRLNNEPDPIGPPGHQFLPGGLVPATHLASAVREDERAAVADRVGGRIPTAWRTAVGQWVEHGDLVVLADAIESATLRSALALFRRGDPLGTAIPVAFIRAKENEVRNLRLISRGIVNRTPSTLIEERLRVA